MCTRNIRLYLYVCDLGKVGLQRKLFVNMRNGSALNGFEKVPCCGVISEICDSNIPKISWRVNVKCERYFRARKPNSQRGSEKNVFHLRFSWKGNPRKIKTWCFAKSCYPSKFDKESKNVSEKHNMCESLNHWTYDFCYTSPKWFVLYIRDYRILVFWFNIFPKGGIRQ